MSARVRLNLLLSLSSHLAKLPEIGSYPRLFWCLVPLLPSSGFAPDSSRASFTWALMGRGIDLFLFSFYCPHIGFPFGVTGISLVGRSFLGLNKWIAPNCTAFGSAWLLGFVVLRDGRSATLLLLEHWAIFLLNPHSLYIVLADSESQLVIVLDWKSKIKRNCILILSLQQLRISVCYYVQRQLLMWFIISLFFCSFITITEHTKSFDLILDFPQSRNHRRLLLLISHILFYTKYSFNVMVTGLIFLRMILFNTDVDQKQHSWLRIPLGKQINPKPNPDSFKANSEQVDSKVIRRTQIGWRMKLNEKALDLDTDPEPLLTLRPLRSNWVKIMHRRSEIYTVNSIYVIICTY